MSTHAPRIIGTRRIERRNLIPLIARRWTIDRTITRNFRQPARRVAEHRGASGRQPHLRPAGVDGIGMVLSGIEQIFRSSSIPISTAIAFAAGGRRVLHAVRGVGINALLIAEPCLCARRRRRAEERAGLAGGQPSSFRNKPVALINPSPRATHALAASDRSTLETMSAAADPEDASMHAAICSARRMIACAAICGECRVRRTTPQRARARR